MAKELTISTTARNAALDAVTALLDIGGSATMEIYNGTKPVGGPSTPISDQVKGVTLTMSSTAFAAAVEGGAMANPITSGVGVANITATWARLKSGEGTPVMDYDVDEADATALINTTTITIGLEVSCSSFTLSHPA